MARGRTTHRKPSATKAALQYFHCMKCSKKYQGKKDLADHVRVVHRQNPFRCNTCRRPFQSRSGYRKHVNKNAYKPQQQLPFQPRPITRRESPPSVDLTLAPREPASSDDDLQQAPQQSPTKESPQGGSNLQQSQESSSPVSPHQQSPPPTKSSTDRNHFKGGMRLGTGGIKRHRKTLRDSIQGIRNTAIRRLARRGGVKRISGLIFEETRGALKLFLENVIRDAITYTEYARRKVINTTDIIHALKRRGCTLYEFGG